MSDRVAPDDPPEQRLWAAIRSDRANASNYVRLARLYAERGRPDAITHYLSALRIDPRPDWLTELRRRFPGLFSHVVVFTHVPRTAGSTLHSIMASRCLANEIQSISSLRPDPDSRLRSVSDRIRYVHGHVKYCSYASVARPIRRICILRNPVEREASVKRLILRSTNHPLCAEMLAAGTSVANYVDIIRTAGLDNAHVRLLGGDMAEDGSPAGGRAARSAIVSTSPSAGSPRTMCSGSRRRWKSPRPSWCATRSLFRPS